MQACLRRGQIAAPVQPQASPDRIDAKSVPPPLPHALLSSDAKSTASSMRPKLLQAAPTPNRCHRHLRAHPKSLRAAPTLDRWFTAPQHASQLLQRASMPDQQHHGLPSASPSFLKPCRNQIGGPGPSPRAYALL
ncbi:hypothetical protein COCNU_01G010830 [Cocos nucifera]|uniref:Uncharacterized protein n=1 Tax=Cocos nucifera TaxID=13894 RepID=A0A8K0HV99_COCNU|nr:hypothetical protein COCNU_01G010830 [Cocos nucifera]